jgi:hypothetical protein
MYARMSTLEGLPDEMDEGLRQVREQVLPLLQQQDGSKGSSPSVTATVAS